MELNWYTIHQCIYCDITPNSDNSFTLPNILINPLLPGGNKKVTHI